MNSIPASRYMRTEKVPKRYATGHDSEWITTERGTTAPNFHGRARVKRLRLRKLQRIARRRSRP